MSEYSERSQALARELAEKAAKNLRRSGRTVERSATTGRYVVSRKPDPDITISKRDGSGWTVTGRKG
jgi:hypothetical protein